MRYNGHDYLQGSYIMTSARQLKPFEKGMMKITTKANHKLVRSRFRLKPEKQVNNRSEYLQQRKNKTYRFFQDLISIDINFPVR